MRVFVTCSDWVEMPNNASTVHIPVGSSADGRAVMSERREIDRVICPSCGTQRHVARHVMVYCECTIGRPGKP